MLPRITNPKAWPRPALLLSILVLLLTAGSRTAGALETSIRVASDPDDPIGQGAEFYFGEGIAAFSAVEALGIITVTVDPAGPGEVWSFEFQVPPGGDLVPGLYTDAAGIPSQSPATPGIRICTDSRACGDVTGSFEIRELALGAGGTVDAFRATFEQHCGGQAPAIRGEICFQADVPVRIDAPRVFRLHRGDYGIFFAIMTEAAWQFGSLAAAGLPPGASFTDYGDNSAGFFWETTLSDVGRWPMQITGDVLGQVETADVLVDVSGDHRLALDSEAGEPLADGQDLAAGVNDGWFRASQEAGGVTLEFESWSGDDWSLRMLGPDGGPLLEGFSGAAADPGSASPGTAGLVVSRNGVTCPAASGWIDVRELRYDDRGFLLSVRAAFEQRCADPGPPLRGEAWFNARALVSVTAPAEGTVLAGQPVAFAVNGFDVRGSSVALAGAGLPAGASFSDGGAGAGQFSWTPTTGQLGEFTVTFVATGAGGAADQAVTRLTVVRPNGAPTADAGGPYAAEVGSAIVFDGSGSSDPENDPLARHWWFGDGAESTDPAPAHAYAATGNYDVVLEVCDGSLCDRDTTRAVITFTPPPPDERAARAFVTAPNRELRLFSTRPWHAVQLEPVDRSFAIGEVDPAGLAMVSEGTGSVTRVAALAERSIPDRDWDRNGQVELAVTFDLAALRPLFDALAEPTRVPVRIEGRLRDGTPLAADVTLEVFPRGGPPLRARSLDGGAGLVVGLDQPGRVRVRLFDLGGRLVQELLDADLAAGEHAVNLDAGPGARLTPGVYFYRVEAADARIGGKLVVVR